MQGSCQHCGLALARIEDHDCPVLWRQKQENWYHRLEARRIEAAKIEAALLEEEAEDEISVHDINERMTREWIDFLDTLPEVMPL